MSSLAQFLPTPAAFIDGIGGPELVLILVIALLLFGGKGMPNMAKTIGRTLREFKKATSGIENEIKRAMHDDDDEPAVRPRRHLADQPATPPPAASGAAASEPAKPAADSNPRAPDA